MNQDYSNIIEQCLPELAPFYAEFLEDRWKEMVVLKDFIQKKDFNNITTLAHRWKGFCSPYGFGILGELSRELEFAAKDNSLEAVTKIVQSMEEYLIEKRQGAP